VIIALIIGFLVVACAGVTGYLRGRKAAAAVLGVGAALLVVVAVASGRDAAHAFMGGSLVGLPVLIGAFVARDRRERAA